MPATFAVAVLAHECGARLLGTLDSLEHQAARPHEIIIVHRGAPDEPAPPMIRAVASRSRVHVIACERPTPGALRNSAIARATSELVSWIDEGDLLHPAFCAAMARALEGGTCSFAAAVVTLSTMAGDPHLTPQLLVPALDLETLLRAADRVPVSPAVRRSGWAALGGFDDSLEAYDEYDFWLRMTSSDSRGVLVERPLVTRAIFRDSAWRRALEPDTAAASIRSVIRKHLTLFQHDPASVLISRERRLQDLVHRHRDAVGRRDRFAGEIEAAKAEAEALERLLASQGREGIEWGDLRHTAPVSFDWGYDRGTPVDRYYIEQFLDDHAADIQGVVLEVQESNLTRRYGQDRVERADVVDVNPSNPGATIIADLRDATPIPSDSYDCFILTQTIHVIDDMTAVLRECLRILKPGGVLLVTLPCASRVCLEYGPDGDFWRVTEAGARKLFSGVFPLENLEITTYGNVMVNTAFLYGLGCHEITPAEFERYEPYHPALIGVRAMKPITADAPVAAGRRAVTAASGRESEPSRGVVLLYHRVAEPAFDVHGLAVSRRAFRRQMEFLKRAWTVIPLDAFVEMNAAGRLPERAVAITFDDGYLDNLEHAAPILVELGLPATFFLTTQALRGRPEYWWDTLERVLLAAAGVPPALELSLEGEILRLATANMEQRIAAHGRIHQALVKAALADRDRCVHAILAWGGHFAPPPAAQLLTAGGMLELARLPGCAIGAHTVHHLGLPAQPADVAEREMRESREELETLLGQAITAVAYPYGYYDAATLEAARRAGFQTGLTCDVRAVSRLDQPLCLPRCETKGGGVAEMERQLASSLNAGS